MVFPHKLQFFKQYFLFLWETQSLSPEEFVLPKLVDHLRFENNDDSFIFSKRELGEYIMHLFLPYDLIIRSTTSVIPIFWIF